MTLEEEAILMLAKHRVFQDEKGRRAKQAMLELIQKQVIKAQIEENDSILEMLKVHGDARSYFVVSERMKELYQQLTEL
jgi:hypothetical protein